jgi:transcription antitermination factor NusG
MMREAGPQSLQWYAFRVRPRHEKFVSTSLRNKGYSEFLPLTRARHRWADRYKTVELPLFPGYIFCETEYREIGHIRLTPGILDVIRAGSSPLPARREEIDDLRLASQHAISMESCALIETASGQRLRIASGPLRGFTGFLVEIRGKQRLVLSVDLLRRSVLVELPSESIDPIFRPSTIPDRYIINPRLAKLA